MFTEDGRKLRSGEGDSDGPTDAGDRCGTGSRSLKLTDFLMGDIRTRINVDSPWCTMTSTHASKRHLDSLPAALRGLYFPPATKAENHIPGRLVKGRNEPCAIGGVCWVVSRLHEGVTAEDVAEAAWKNTVDVFGLEVNED